MRVQAEAVRVLGRHHSEDGLHTLKKLSKDGQQQDARDAPGPSSTASRPPARTPQRRCMSVQQEALRATAIVQWGTCRSTCAHCTPTTSTTRSSCARRTRSFARWRSTSRRSPIPRFTSSCCPKRRSSTVRCSPVAMADFGRILELTGQLRTIGVGEIVFPVRRDHGRTPALRAPSSVHAQADAHRHARLRPHPCPGARVFRGGVGRARQSPGGHLALHRTPRWTRRARGIGGGGHRPTMAPFMRHMRLLIDLDQEHRYVIQHLCLARRPAAGEWSTSTGVSDIPRGECRASTRDDAIGSDGGGSGLYPRPRHQRYAAGAHGGQAAQLPTLSDLAPP